MSSCGGKGFDDCEDCINAECDPFQCDDCDDGSNWEGDDDSEEMTIEQLKVFMMKVVA